jgi:hypothetical protein
MRIMASLKLQVGAGALLVGTHWCRDHAIHSRITVMRCDHKWRLLYVREQEVFSDQIVSSRESCPPPMPVRCMGLSSWEGSTSYSEFSVLGASNQSTSPGHCLNAFLYQFCYVLAPDYMLQLQPVVCTFTLLRRHPWLSLIWASLLATLSSFSLVYLQSL